MPLHVTNGDAVVPELVDLAGVPADDVLAWREILHDGPVPADLGPGELARVRARHITARSLSHADVEVSEETALAMFRERDERLASWPADAEVVLWFEEDLFDRLLLAQVEDRLTGRPGPVSRVYLRHPPRGDLRAALDARERIDPLVVFAGLGPGRPPPYPPRLTPGREAWSVKLGGEDSNPRSEDQNLVS